MRKNTFKSIISLVIIIFLLIPNLSIAAVEVNGILEPNIEENKQIEVLEPEATDTAESVKLEDQNINPKVDIIKTEEKTEVKTEVKIDTKPDVEKKVESISGETYKLTEKPQTEVTNSQGLTEAEYEREDVKGRLEAISQFEYLVPKTSSNYEIAMAHPDGTYSYVEAVDTLEGAIAEVKDISLPESNDGNLPAVINNDGQVVYSTNSMLRILSDTGNINLYTDPSLKNAFTYINQGYIEDAPIIEDNGVAIKIEVAGFTGWISKATTSQVLPMNQVINPSYYISQGGVLKHFISYDLTSTTNNGTTITLGKAPSYLKDGVKYFSYDGNYFYEGSNMATGLNNVISDLRNGNHNSSINSSNPYYLYFNYLPFRSTTSYSAAELNKFIDDNTDASSKLRGIGQALIDAQNAYGVNAVLTLGVAINESGWGTSKISKEKNNLFGIKAFDTSPGLSADAYNTPGDSVLEFTKNYISRGYADPADWRYKGGFIGNKNKGANVKYASDPFWGEKAAQFAHKIDFYLSSSNLNNLRDQNAYQLAMYKSDNQVKNDSGTLLYNITSDLKQYAGYHDTPLIIKNKDVVLKNGASCYEMYPERDTPVGAGGAINMFSGSYKWDVKGYVNTNGVKFINEGTRIATNGVEYQTHIQDIGWQDWKSNGDTSGTSGQSKRLEAIKININNIISGASIEYRTHVQDYGWQPWKSNGELSGTSGESKRLEGIEIRLKNAPGYSVQYRVHVEDYGWQNWKANAETAGTVGKGKRLEAIQIRIVKDSDYKLTYRSHVQEYGWQDWKNSAQTSGTVGSSKRLEGVEIKLDGAPEGTKISYQVHVQDYGWQNWKENGQLAGTVGQLKRLEAIKIKLENAPGYKVEYRTHVQDYGWQNWKSEGEMSGTEGQGKRLEAIEIRIVRK
ncbi:glucosaminidase domain-containing protein [Clostridium gasigenes]|uniref:Glucosaminidase domain-containing protein n=1 Tax=Clostridium gasigenes TaxID=94869 RepID=A0A7X0SDE2_9CLOT|nr:glucosaminidase domain-containing protein [Clostridium gasigenes]MBB6713531.1 glucosaminidase domain-containing protein [Clostridium gasigenes]